MQTKEKRKINPRRRLLMRLILTIVAIAILLVLGWRALTPKGVQIVYIAPDENGYDAIWLADLNDPEHPRQLTFHEGMFIRDFQVSEENSIIFYNTFSHSSSETNNFWMFNLNSGQLEQLEICGRFDVCINFQLHPSGKWLIYEYFGNHLDIIYAYDLRTFEKHLVFDFEKDLIDAYTLRWVGNTDTLAFRITDGSNYDEYALYSMEEHSIVDTLLLETGANILYFSQNGIFYEHYYNVLESLSPQLRDINNPDLALHLPYPVYDWHPNDEELLMVNYTYDSWGIDETMNANVFLFNMLTGDYEVLLSVENSSPQPTFNAEGSQILYSVYIPEVYNQIMLFDMETHQEITLPIVGRDPQWVNGGR